MNTNLKNDFTFGTKDIVVSQNEQMYSIIPMVGGNFALLSLNGMEILKPFSSSREAVEYLKDYCTIIKVVSHENIIITL